MENIKKAVKREVLRLLRRAARRARPPPARDVPRSASLPCRCPTAPAAPPPLTSIADLHTFKLLYFFILIILTKILIVTTVLLIIRILM